MLNIFEKDEKPVYKVGFVDPEESKFICDEEDRYNTFEEALDAGCTSINS
jgi:hypothetical protein